MKIKTLITQIKEQPVYKFFRNIYTYVEFKLEKKGILLTELFVYPWIKNNKTNLPINEKMKLGISYNVFDGEELLEYSIKSIRQNVDFICVVWQNVSYHGEPCSDKLEDLLLQLLKDGLIDQLFLYKPNTLQTGGEISSIKRNIGLELCRKNGCNYHMTIDTDEFYTDEQFKFMKKEMIRGNYGTGYCRHMQYYKDSIYQIKFPERYYVPTIEKITPHTKYVYGASSPVVTSPERKTNNVSENKLPYRIFNRKECEMHHMSFVRKDIAGKLRNGSLDKAFSKESVDAVVKHYENWSYPEKCMWAGNALWEVIQVPRQFEIYKID